MNERRLMARFFEYLNFGNKENHGEIEKNALRNYGLKFDL